MEKFRFGFANMNLERAKEAIDAGESYQELSFKSVYNLTEEQIQEYLDFSKKYDIKFETANGMLPNDLKVVGDDIDENRLDEYLETTFEKGYRLGIKYIVFGSSGARELTRGYDINKAYNQIVDFLKNRVVPLCEKYDMYCVLENLSWNECNTLVFIDESYKICEKVNNDRVGILVDYYHFGFNEDSYESLRQAQKYIKHIHVASVKNHRHYPSPDDGEAQSYKKFADFLREIGYDKREGRITFEARTADGKSTSQSYAESIATFENL